MRIFNKQSIRLWLYANKKIFTGLRIIRYLIHHLPIKYLIIQTFKIVSFKPILRSTISIDKGLSFNEIVSNINTHGFSIGSVVSKEIVSKILRNYENDTGAVYYDAHLNNKDLNDLITSDYIIGIVCQYLGFEPKLFSCTVTVDIPGSQKTTKEAESFFHYDISGVKSLNVFIYLTDVCEESMPHIAIQGSHKHKRFRHLFSGKLNLSEAEKFYSNRIMSLTGKSGTIYFENTEVFHKKGLPRSKDRVMINVLYTHPVSPIF